MTFHQNPVAKYAEIHGYRLAALIDHHFGIVVKPKPFWMPGFIYNAVIRNEVEIVNTEGIATRAYLPEV